MQNKDNVEQQINNAIHNLLGSTHHIDWIKESCKSSASSTLIVQPKCGGNIISFSINSLMQLFNNGIGVGDIAYKIFEIVTQESEHSVNYLNDIARDFESAQNSLYAELIPTSKHSDLLNKIPHFDVYDVSIVYRIVFECNNGKIAKTYVTDELFEQWHITADQLHNAAIANTRRRRPHMLKPIGSLLSKLIDSSEEMDSNMIVITNVQMMYGSIYMTDSDLLYEASKLLMSDTIYVLPSSIHEVIACPTDIATIEEVRQLVFEINHSVLSADEFLSNSIYIFTSSKMQLSKVA